MILGMRRKRVKQIVICFLNKIKELAAQLAL